MTVEVTSKEVGRKAARLLKRKTLTDADLADVKAVAASALTQRGVEAKIAPALAAFMRLAVLIEKAGLPNRMEARMLAELEKCIAPISPAK